MAINYSQLYSNPLPKSSAVDDYISQSNKRRQQELEASKSAISTNVRLLEMRQKQLQNAIKNKQEFDKANPVARITQAPESGEYYQINIDKDGNFTQDSIDEEDYIRLQKYNKDVEEKGNLILQGHLTAQNANNAEAYSSAKTKAKEDAVRGISTPTGVETNPRKSLAQQAYESLGKVTKTIGETLRDSAPAVGETLSKSGKAIGEGVKSTMDYIAEPFRSAQDTINTKLNKRLYDKAIEEGKDPSDGDYMKYRVRDKDEKKTPYFNENRVESPGIDPTPGELKSRRFDAKNNFMEEVLRKKKAQDREKSQKLTNDMIEDYLEQNNVPPSMWDKAKVEIKKAGGLNKVKYQVDKGKKLRKATTETKIIKRLDQNDKGDNSVEYDYLTRPGYKNQFNRIPDSGEKVEAPKNFYEMFTKPKTYTKKQLDDLGIEY